MGIVAILFIIGALICVFLGKAAIAAAAAHVETEYPEEFARLSKHGLLPIKGLSGDADRVRRGLAGPLLTGWLHKDLRKDPMIQGCQKQWRLAFCGLIVCFVMAITTLGGQ